MKIQKKLLILSMLCLWIILLSVCGKKAENTGVFVVDSVRSADSVSIVYQTEGVGDTAIVFVHCWCGDRSYWRYQWPVFAGRFHVVALDLAGHGQSGLERRDWSISAYGKDVAAVVNQLNLSNLILVGHSMGSAVITEAAKLLKGKVIGLIAVDMMQNVENVNQEEGIQQYINFLKSDFAGNTRMSMRSVFSKKSDSLLVDTIIADMSSAPADVAIASINDLLHYSFAQGLDSVQLPVVCINTDRRPTDTEAGKRHAPFFETRIIAGYGHFLPLETPETFNRELSAAIDTLLLHQP